MNNKLMTYKSAKPLDLTGNYLLDTEKSMASEKKQSQIQSEFDLRFFLSFFFLSLSLCLSTLLWKNTNLIFHGLNSTLLWKKLKPNLPWFRFCVGLLLYLCMDEISNAVHLFVPWPPSISESRHRFHQKVQKQDKIS